MISLFCIIFEFKGLLASMLVENPPDTGLELQPATTYCAYWKYEQRTPHPRTSIHA